MPEHLPDRGKKKGDRRVHFTSKEKVMRKIIPLALLALALPAVAQAQDPDDITVQGRHGYTTKSQLTPQTYKLQGKLADGRYFRLSVKGRRVSGDVGGMPVYFHMPRPGHIMGHPMHASPA
jgi:hypothetical protein